MLERKVHGQSEGINQLIDGCMNRWMNRITNLMWRDRENELDQYCQR